MLLTTIEVIPHGQWEDRYSIHKIYIANVGGNEFKADYHIWFNEDPTDKTQFRLEPHIAIKKFKRQLGAIELLRQVLNKQHSKVKRKKDVKS